MVHLVDDDAAVRGTLARLLSSGGYDVREYGSGDDLLESPEPLGGMCILLDINMPERDGFAVHRALIDRQIDIPVIMMTGSGDLTILALKAGVADFLQKPFDRGMLLSVLHQLAVSSPVGRAGPTLARPSHV